MLGATLAFAVTLSSAPMADVWPYAVKRAPDGALEYAYDLSLLKRSKGSPDAIETHGEEKVAAFLEKLPKSATVRVAPGVGLDVSAGRGLEWGALAQSFAQVGDGPYTSDNPLAKRPSARLRAPLDPEEPKLLLPVDLVGARVRQVEDAALAGVEADTERLRRQLFTQAAERAVKRFGSTDGDAREGALALAGRLAAAAACLDEAKLAASKPQADVLAAARAEVQRLTHDPDALVAPAPWSRTPELACAWVRMRALAQPFEQSRAGTAAVLTYLLLLEKDAKLAALDAKVRARRDCYLGAPTAEPLLVWKEKANGGAEASLDRMNEFIEALPMDARRPPGLFAAPSTPFSGFLAQLEGAERGAAMEELAAAVQDGRVTPATGADAPWPVAREAALAALATDAKAVGFDGGWRARLRVAFAALQVAHLDGRGGGLEVNPDPHERSALSVRLMVPPTLDVEPLPEAYERLAASLERLAQQLAADGLGGVQGVETDGRRSGAVAAEAKRWIPRLRGLAKLARPGAAPDGKDVAEARRFVAGWRAESGGDVRQAAASPVSLAGERQHSAVVGVSRRELVVSFAGAPTVSVVGSPSGLTAQPGEQRYLVPVLVTAGATAPAGRPALDAKALKAALDGVQRDATRADGALAEALGK
ncbi:MAG: hypothetical protein AB1730_08995 [Myxococcota bacterium]